MNSAVTYRCPKKCPIRKNCFVIKLSAPPAVQIEILFKCPAEKGKDIPIRIGENRPP